MKSVDKKSVDELKKDYADLTDKIIVLENKRDKINNLLYNEKKKEDKEQRKRMMSFSKTLIGKLCKIDENTYIIPLDCHFNSSFNDDSSILLDVIRLDFSDTGIVFNDSKYCQYKICHEQEIVGFGDKDSMFGMIDSICDRIKKSFNENIGKKKPRKKKPNMTRQFPNL